MADKYCTIYMQVPESLFPADMYDSGLRSALPFKRFLDLPIFGGGRGVSTGRRRLLCVVISYMGLMDGGQSGNTRESQKEGV